MKKIVVLIYVLSISILGNAQAPQAFNYQAAVYSTSGNPITNQLISLRISILDGTSTGPVLYSESFSTTTDNTGLFNVSIGTGTSLTGSFSGIKWAAGSKWQKTEIDTTGGSSYIIMGTSQYQSVPYSLYAQKSNSASFEYPDGTDNLLPVMIPANVVYTVPSLKNFYVSNYGYYGFILNGDTVQTGSSLVGYKRDVFAAGENAIIHSSEAINGFLVDKSVTWIKHNWQSGAYTVPAKKQLIITFWSFNYAQYAINGSNIAFPRDNTLLVDENQTLSISQISGGGANYFLGYLKDK